MRVNLLADALERVERGFGAIHRNLGQDRRARVGRRLRLRGRHALREGVRREVLPLGKRQEELLERFSLRVWREVDVLERVQRERRDVTQDPTLAVVSGNGRQLEEQRRGEPRDGAVARRAGIPQLRDALRQRRHQQPRLSTRRQQRRQAVTEAQCDLLRQRHVVDVPRELHRHQDLLGAPQPENLVLNLGDRHRHGRVARGPLGHPRRQRAFRRHEKRPRDRAHRRERGTRHEVAAKPLKAHRVRFVVEPGGPARVDETPRNRSSRSLRHPEASEPGRSHRQVGPERRAGQRVHAHYPIGGESRPADDVAVSVVSDDRERVALVRGEARHGDARYRAIRG